MKCPFCSAPDTQVIDSRVNEEGTSVRRRRRCPVCHKRYTTYETAELRMPTIVKSNGQREDFARAKVETSFHRALHKRPVMTEQIDQAVDRIEQSILLDGGREVQSQRIGEMVMNELKALDKVGYIRFASVYRAFEGVEDFREALKDLKK
ncbi:MAG: transcriptional repressor NrdR [Betaproteobacteria bacterium]|nr:transcriptional repressor NrdR [Betaproteobacteria bacterium]